MTEDVSRLWGETLTAVSRLLPRPSYEAWVRPARAVGFDQGTLVLGVPSPACRRMVEERFLSILEKTAREVFQSPLSIHLVAPEEEPDGFLPPAAPNDQSPPSGSRPLNEAAPTLNARYTFESFVVGNANQLAHAAALAVSQMPATAYNPLFIYGGVGLGKTHLMHAIGNAIHQRHAHLKVCYVPAEVFTNDMVDAIRDDRMVAFRNRFRNVDVLLIDDIQFISGKERTQEEFFHTFETLHWASKQIVLSSDRLPREIPTLTERLRSRFEWGLITDMQPPDLETRIAILEKKLQLENLRIPGKVVSFIAEKIDTNIRELEGALIRIVAYLSIHGEPCTVSLAERILQDLIPKPKLLTIDRIQDEVCRVYGLSKGDMNGRSRARSVSFPRQIAMFLCRELTGNSLPMIGQAFGDRDHTTVMHAIEKVQAEAAADASLSELLEDLSRKLRG